MSEQLTKPNRLLLEKYFEMNDLKQRTKDKYTNYFKKFQQQLRDYKISPPNIHTNINILIQISNEQFELGNLKAEYIKQFFQLLKPLVKEKKSVLETVEIYTKLTNNHYKDKTKNELKNADITYKDLTNLLKNKDVSNSQSEYDDEVVSDIDYVLFYILINYGVRNLDLIINLQDDNGNENYMYVNEKSIRYVRNNYKTYKQYGTKKISIKNPRFISIIKQYVADGKKYLFGGYDETNMSNYINTRFNHYLNTDKRINEGLVYKIVINHYSCIGDTKKQIALANSRGHDITTQSTCYE
jgi:hypothetical protein